MGWVFCQTLKYAKISGCYEKNCLANIDCWVVGAS